MQKKGKRSRASDVRIIEASCYRTEDIATIDGKLAVEAERSLNKLQLLIDFIDSDQKVLSTRRGLVTEEMLETGDESEFHMQVAATPRSVYFAIRAESGERELRVQNQGPFEIT